MRKWATKPENPKAQIPNPNLTPKQKINTQTQNPNPIPKPPNHMVWSVGSGLGFMRLGLGILGIWFGGSGFGDRGFGFGLAWRRFVSFGAGGHVKGWTNKQTNNETHEGSIFVLRIQCSKTWLLLGPIHIQPNGVYGCMSQDVFRLSAPKTTPLQNHPPPPIPTANPQTRNPKT